MYHIKEKDKCSLFQAISVEVWNQIAFQHSAGVEVPEIGITNAIVSVLRDHSQRIQGFGAWSNLGKHEAIWGTDIDLFIEVSTGNYVWHALQAKVLKLNESYHFNTPEKLKSSELGAYEVPQWMKLAKLQAKSGCMPYYLLYNGVGRLSGSTFRIGIETLKAEHFGCSLAQLRDIQMNHDTMKAKFVNFHPKLAHPWHQLACSNPPASGVTLYSTDQIQNRLRNYYPEADITLERRLLPGSNPPNELPENVIQSTSEEFGREPVVTMVIQN